jgi:hypothetical protein
LATSISFFRWKSFNFVMIPVSRIRGKFNRNRSGVQGSEVQGSAPPLATETSSLVE